MPVAVDPAARSAAAPSRIRHPLTLIKDRTSFIDLWHPGPQAVEVLPHRTGSPPSRKQSLIPTNRACHLQFPSVREMLSFAESSFDWPQFSTTRLCSQAVLGESCTAATGHGGVGQTSLHSRHSPPGPLIAELPVSFVAVSASWLATMRPDGSDPGVVEGCNEGWMEPVEPPADARKGGHHDDTPVAFNPAQNDPRALGRIQSQKPHPSQSQLCL